MHLKNSIISTIIILIVGTIIVYQITQIPPEHASVTIDNHIFAVEVETKPAQQQRGLSDRISLAQNQGMLFVFQTPYRYPFWMKKMNFPLDMIFINDNKIVSLFQNVPAPKKDTNFAHDVI